MIRITRKLTAALPSPSYRIETLLLAVGLLTGMMAAAASPAKADWTETRPDGCTYTCHWYVTDGTCKGPLGVSVPCPVRKKRCSRDYCTQSFR